MKNRTIKPGIPSSKRNNISSLEGITNDTVLYKYFSCETFCKFLKNPSLKFAKPTNWDDKFEGHRHNFFQNAYRDNQKAECYRAMCWTLGADDPICYGNDLAVHEAAIKELHEFGYAAMWESYCRDGGVRIKSTYGKLKKMLIKELPSGGIWAGNVRYEPESLWQSLPGATGLVGQLFIKGVTFKHEAEFRFIFLPESQECPEEIYLPINNPYEFIDELLIAPESGRKPWGAYSLYIDCLNTFSTPVSGPTNIKNGVHHSRISNLYGNISMSF